MSAELPSELAKFVQDEVASGRFRSETEVIQRGLSLLRERQQKLDLLRADLEPALARLDSGEGIELEIQDVKARGRRRLENQNT